MMQSDNLFGNWLRQQRKTLDLTQAELAHQIGCAPVTVKKIESGVLRPSKQIAERMATVLAIEPSILASFVAFARGLSTVPPTEVPPGAEAGSAHHLPSQPTTFVGRSRELAIFSTCSTPLTPGV